MNKTLKQYLEEICSTNISGVEQNLFNSVQERKIPEINKTKTKRRKKHAKNRTKRTTD